MKCDFHIGQKVVCIARGDWRKAKIKYLYRVGIGLNVPVSGQVYTIRDLVWDDRGPDGPDDVKGIGAVGVLLMEVVNGIDPDTGIESLWPSYEFKPLNESKTDIGVFTKMLDKVDA